MRCVLLSSIESPINYATEALKRRNIRVDYQKGIADQRQLVHLRDIYLLQNDNDVPHLQDIAQRLGLRLEQQRC